MRSKRPFGWALLYICTFILMVNGCVTWCLTEAKVQDRSVISGETAANRVSGIFVAPELSAGSTEEQWQQALTDMKGIGIDTVIIQYSYQNKSWGHQEYFPFEQNDAGSQSAGSLTGSQVPFILSAAGQLHMKVFVGLQIAENEWFEKEMYQDIRWLQEQCAFSLKLAQSLWDLYGDSYGNVIAGWYLPFEFESDEEYHPYYRQIMEQYYAPLTSSLKNDSRFGSLDILISPLMFQNNDIAAWQEGLRTILSGSQIDILAPQDGIGYGTQTQSSVGEWFRATKEVVDEVNLSQHRHIRMWANCENYARRRSVSLPAPYDQKIPMSIQKYIRSLDVAGPFAEKLITFSIHRWDTVLANSAKELNAPYYEAYKKYFTSGIRPAGLAGGYFVDIRPQENGSLVFHRYARAGLTDGFAATKDGWEGYRGICSEDRKPFTMEICFDDPVRIGRITSNYYGERKASILLPEKVRYEYRVQSDYVPFCTDTFAGGDGVFRSFAVLAKPVMADGIRITVFPGGKWTFLDDIQVEE